MAFIDDFGKKGKTQKPSQMEKLNEAANKFENTLEVLSAPVKPYFPTIARFLLVATFLEDTVRMITQWDDQVFYLTHRRGFPWLTSEMFLAYNVIAMIGGSFLAIAKKYTEHACAALLSVVIVQTLGYGLLFDLSFLFRNLSVIGGLLMLLADGMLSQRKNLFAGLPSINEADRSTYIMLFGRILLVFLFMSFVMQGEFGPIRVFVIIVSFFGCIMIVVGFKAKWSAWVLLTFMSIGNVVLNNWWSLHHTHHSRDFMKYDFFQVLSIMGGFLLLVSIGPGGMSMDEKKKSF